VRISQEAVAPLTTTPRVAELDERGVHLGGRRLVGVRDLPHRSAGEVDRRLQAAAG
jgi:hypothetical protein